MSNNREWYANYVYQPTDRLAGLPTKLANLLKGELSEDEDILWMAKPSFKVRIWERLAPSIGLGVIFTLGAFIAAGLKTWDFRVFSSSLWIWWVAMPVAWLVFTGLYNYQAKNSLYLLTTRRVLHVNAVRLLTTRIKSYNLSQLDSFDFEVRNLDAASGRGDLTLTREKQPFQQAKEARLEFVGIQNAAAIKQLLKEKLAEPIERPLEVLPTKTQALVNAELSPTEEVLWAGQPSLLSIPSTASFLLKAGLFTCITLAIVGLVLIAFILNNLFLGTVPAGLLCFLVAVALFVPVSRGFTRADQKRYEQLSNTAYVVTNERVLAIEVDQQGKKKVGTFRFDSKTRNTTVKKVRPSFEKELYNLSVVEDKKDAYSPHVRFLGIREGHKVVSLIEQQLTTTVSI